MVIEYSWNWKFEDLLHFFGSVTSVAVRHSGGNWESGGQPYKTKAPLAAGVCRDNAPIPPKLIRADFIPVDLVEHLVPTARIGIVGRIAEVCLAIASVRADTPSSCPKNCKSAGRDGSCAGGLDRLNARGRDRFAAALGHPKHNGSFRNASTTAGSRRSHSHGVRAGSKAALTISAGVRLPLPQSVRVRGDRCRTQPTRLRLPHVLA